VSQKLVLVEGDHKDFGTPEGIFRPGVPKEVSDKLANYLLGTYECFKAVDQKEERPEKKPETSQFVVQGEEGPIVLDKMKKKDLVQVAEEYGVEITATKVDDIRAEIFEKWEED